MLIGVKIISGRTYVAIYYQQLIVLYAPLPLTLQVDVDGAETVDCGLKS